MEKKANKRLLLYNNNSLRFNYRKIFYLVFSSTHLRALTNASIHGVI